MRTPQGHSVKLASGLLPLKMRLALDHKRGGVESLLGVVGSTLVLVWWRHDTAAKQGHAQGTQVDSGVSEDSSNSEHLGFNANCLCGPFAPWLFPAVDRRLGNRSYR